MRRELVHHLGQHVAELAEQVALVQPELFGQTADHVAPQHAAQLVGLDGPVLAGADPAAGHVAQAALLHLGDQATEPTQSAGLLALAEHADDGAQQVGLAASTATLRLTESTNDGIEQAHGLLLERVGGVDSGGAQCGPQGRQS